MQILDAQATAKALPYDRLVDAIDTAALQLASGDIVAPERLVVPTGKGVLLCMPAIGPHLGVTKLITVHNDNPAQGLPAIQGEVTVFEVASGRRLMMLDGPTVTARRTAAVTLSGIRSILQRPPRSALLIGTGAQAMAHAEALVEFLRMPAIFVASRHASHAEAFCANLQQRYPATRFQAADVADVAGKVDIVIALTTSRVPVIPSDLPDSTLAVGVGAFKPDMAELPPELLRRRRIVVDHLAGARHEAGDLLQAGIEWNAVHDLGKVLGSLGDGTFDPAQPTVLKTVGHAAWDLAAAQVAARSVLPQA
jgi:1-piperideine-2-carboxylate/1-pyrroline-2-carboxylate reductase [NAD(P)H]